jgi:hypothetical protein
MSSDQTTIRLKKLLEPPANREELLRNWLKHVHKGRDRHDLAARRNDAYRYWLGVPAIILSTVVGTSVFASLNTQVDTRLKIVLGLISITAAVLASLQTFYDFAARAERHRVAGVKYKTIIRELEEVLTPLDQSADKAEYLNDLRKRLDDMELEAPVVPAGVYRHVEDRYDTLVHAE